MTISYRLKILQEVQRECAAPFLVVIALIGESLPRSLTERRIWTIKDELRSHQLLQTSKYQLAGIKDGILYGAAISLLFTNKNQ